MAWCAEAAATAATTKAATTATAVAHAATVATTTMSATAAVPTAAVPTATVSATTAVTTAAAACINRGLQHQYCHYGYGQNSKRSHDYIPHHETSSLATHHYQKYMQVSCRGLAIPEELPKCNLRA